MEVVLVTPKRKLFEGRADSITVPGSEGKMQILSDHAPLLSKLCAGDIIIKTDSDIREFKISSGFVEVHNNKVTLLVRTETSPVNQGLE